MDQTISDDGDSLGRQGGEIPGLPGAKAFSVLASAASAIPVLIAVPHAGRAYSPELIARMRNFEFSAPRLEDRYVDLLALAVARETNAALIFAHAPRAMIDLNREADDIDWGMIERTGRNAAAQTIGRRARTGLGLVPRRLPGLGEVWKNRLAESELIERIALIHNPYHEALDDILVRMRDRWGAALLVDLHSMPSLPVRAGAAAPEFVIGDRYGTTSHGTLVAGAFAHFGSMQRLAAHNRPYAGGYVLDRHAAPSAGIHAMQIEIDRASYLDSAMREPGSGFEDMAAVLAGLICRLTGAVCDLGNERAGTGTGAGWAEAAE